MFKTLQNSPSTISIFHNAKIPMSNKLYGILSKANYKLNEDKSKIILDLMENTLPTYDQYSLIVNNCLRDNYSKNVVASCFPFIKGSTENKVGQDRVTVNAPIGLQRLSGSGLKVFNEGEYAMIVEAFNGIEQSDSTEVSASAVFAAPLVVDWDQNMIANDEHGISNILNKYK
ncbi:hypothetical protein PSN45_004840 [Yamadazyma tenuis]|nr:hypothetical protein PSN45_004840 [Yamadazyma tenuis]